MDIKQLVTVILVVYLVGGQCRFHNGQRRLHGRTVQRTPIFNNIAKELADMVRDLFTNTNLKNVTNGYALKNEFVVVDTTANYTDVTSHFPEMVKDYIEYKTDLRLTRDRAIFFVDEKKHKGHDSNVLRWRKSIGDLRKQIFDLINEAIAMVKSMSINNKGSEKKTPTKSDRKRRQEQVNKHQGNIVQLLKNILKKISNIISQKEYVDQETKKAFTSKKQNANRIPEMKAIEGHIVETIREISKRARLWAIEAANFYIKKIKYVI